MCVCYGYGGMLRSRTRTAISQSADPIASRPFVGGVVFHSFILSLFVGCCRSVPSLNPVKQKLGYRSRGPIQSKACLPFSFLFCHFKETRSLGSAETSLAFDLQRRNCNPGKILQQSFGHLFATGCFRLVSQKLGKN